MAGDAGLAAVVLAAGRGQRLRPLTDWLPKPLCPVAGRPLLDLALERVRAAGLSGSSDVAVNACHLADRVAAAVGDRVTLSVEHPEALGTAGALGALRDWLDGRDVLVTNADVVHLGELDLPGFVAGWDRERPRLLVVADPARADFDGRWRFAGVSLLPGAVASGLPAAPLGLYEAVWRDTPLDLVPREVGYVDCAGPSEYLQANLLLSGGESVVAADAQVEGRVTRSVVWSGARVAAGEHLVEMIRALDPRGREVTVRAPLTTM